MNDSTTRTHRHAASDGFAADCPYCGGPTSPVAYDDPRVSCDDCGEFLPCCK